MSNKNLKFKVPGVNVVENPVYLPAEPAPVNRRVYAAAKAPFALMGALVHWVGLRFLAAWMVTGAVALLVTLVVVVGKDATDIGSLLLGAIWMSLQWAVYLLPIAILVSFRRR